MNRVILAIIFLFMLSGCAKEQDLTQRSGLEAPAQEVKQIAPIQPMPSLKEEDMLKPEVVEEKTIEAIAEVATSTQESGFQVRPPVDIVQEMQAQIKEAQPQKASVEPIEAGEKIIAENMWGFAVYDPETGIEEFYTSNGVLLGSKKRL